MAAMVFLISYRNQPHSSNPRSILRKKIFAVHGENPSAEDIVKLVRRVSNGDCAEATIEHEPCPGFDPEELTRCGVTVYRFDR